MKISIIVAASENWVIGSNGHLPWNLSDDLKNFKKITLNKPIIMGRRTFDSIGRALPKRRNIVISNTVTKIPSCEVFSSVDDAIHAAKDADEIMIIGGGQIYKQALPMADTIYLTQVHCSIMGDAFFPPLDLNEWQISHTEHFKKNDKNDHDFEFMILDKAHNVVAK